MEKNDIMSNVINKGVPVSTPITIRYIDLLELCDDKEKFSKIVDKEFDKLIEKIESLFNAENISLYKTMSIKTDPITLEKSIIFSKDGFLSSLMYNLNYDNICRNTNPENCFNEFNYKMLIPRINLLRNIRDEHKLKKEFPALYPKYKSLVELYKKIRSLEVKIRNSKADELAKMQARNAAIKMFNNGGFKCDISIFNLAMSFDIKYFCKTYANCFDNMIQYSNQIIEYIEKNPFSLGNISIDQEKLELYIAYRFLKTIKYDISVDKQKYVYYLANYFKENKSRKQSDEPSIKINGNVEGIGINNTFPEETITPKQVYIQFRDYIINNPNIQLVDFNDVDFNGMSLEEVEIFIEEYLKTFKANWEIIPKNEYSEVREKYNLKGQTKIIDYEKLNELFMEKQEFYSNLDPFMCIRGKETFEGYIGYLFTNGIVVLDKFYENSKTGKVSKGDAIYYMDIKDFYQLSQYTKRDLMKNPKVGRIVHKGNWKKELLKVIEKTGDGINTSNQANDLIKKRLIKEEKKD